jgi:uncharacterized glyoxalase superfamily protein PhnB
MSYLNFAGNAQEAFDFYKSVFGGEFSSTVRFKDFPMEGVTIPKEDEDTSCTSRCQLANTLQESCCYRPR